MRKIEFYKYILQYFQLEIHTRERGGGKREGGEYSVITSLKK